MKSIQQVYERAIEVDIPSVKNLLLQEEKSVEERYNLKIGVSYKYRNLYDFLHKDGDVTVSKILRRRIFEYWVFMMLLEATVAHRLPDNVYRCYSLCYEPAKGRHSQTPIQFERRYGWGANVIPPICQDIYDSNEEFNKIKEWRKIYWNEICIFVEPCLPSYEKKEIMQRYGDIFSYLYINKRTHLNPDFLVAKNLLELPWPAIKNPDMDGRKYMLKFNEVKNQMKCIIECKNESLTKEDKSQILWYSLAYHIPLLVISIEKIEDKEFMEDIDILNRGGNKIIILDGFRIGEQEACVRRLRNVLPDLL